MRTAKSILGLAALGLSSLAAYGQTNLPSLSPLVREGDTVIGLGGVVNVFYVAVNDSKTWMVQMVTSFPEVTRDACLLSNGFVAVREGSPLFSPPAATLDEWPGSINLTSRGDLAMVAKVKPTVGAVYDAILWNLNQVAKRGQTVVSPFLPVQPAPWDTFAVVKLNANNQLFISGEIANPSPQTTRAKERSLVRYDLDDLGNILSTTVLATEGMTVPAGLRLSGAACLGNNDHILAINENGDFITFIAQEGIQALVINMTTVVAKTGTPSPVGKPWRSGGLTLSRVAINDRGDYLISGVVGDTNDPAGFLIVKNGQKFAQAGDIIPSISDAPLGNGSQAPMYITNNGDVFWHARTANDAFVRNYEPVIQVGRTVVDGNLVTALATTENSFSVSPNGRFFVCNSQLQSVGTAILFADFGLVEEIPGCSGNLGKLTHKSGLALVGGEFQLAMANGQIPGAASTLFFSRNPLERTPGSGCGVNIQPYGELLLAPRILGPRSLGTWDGVNPSLATMHIPARVSLIDSVFYAQGIFSKPGSAEPFRMTNAVRVEIGAP